MDRFELQNGSLAKSLRLSPRDRDHAQLAIAGFAAAPAEFWVYDVSPNTLT